MQPLLERAIDAHAKSTRWRKRPAVHAHMAIAAYTILFLDRVPAFAAVLMSASTVIVALNAQLLRRARL